MRQKRVFLPILCTGIFDLNCLDHRKSTVHCTVFCKARLREMLYFTYMMLLHVRLKLFVRVGILSVVKPPDFGKSIKVSLTKTGPLTRDSNCKR